MSTENLYYTYLLPALSDKWESGFVKGLAARGNITVDIEWEKGKVENYTLHGDMSNINVIYKKG